MLEHISNGLIPTGIHRVVADEGQSEGRMSIVQFCHPTPWTILSPLPAASMKLIHNATLQSPPQIDLIKCCGKLT